MMFFVLLVLISFTLSTSTIIYRKNYFYNSEVSPSCEGTPYRIGAFPTGTCLTHKQYDGSGYLVSEVHLKYSAVQSGDKLTFTTTYYTDSECTTPNGSAADASHDYGLDLRYGKVDSAAATVTDVVNATCYDKGSDRGYTQYSLGSSLVYPTESGEIQRLYEDNDCSSTAYGFELYAFDACAYWFPESNTTVYYNESSVLKTYDSTTKNVTQTVYTGKYCSGQGVKNDEYTANNTSECLQIEQYYLIQSIYISPAPEPTSAPSTTSTVVPTAAPTPLKLLLSNGVGAAISFAGIAAHVGLFLYQRFAFAPTTSSSSSTVNGDDTGESSANDDTEGDL